MALRILFVLASFAGLAQAARLAASANDATRRRKCKVDTVGGKCGPLKKCCDGLSCQPGVQKCYNKPRQWGQPCVAGHPCGTNLSCQPGVHKCYNVPRQLDEPCSAGFKCGTDLYCKGGVHKCKSTLERYDPCARGFDVNADLCGCEKPTCIGSRGCVCSNRAPLLPNCGASFPCAPRLDIDLPDLTGVYVNNPGGQTRTLTQSPTEGSTAEGTVAERDWHYIVKWVTLGMDPISGQVSAEYQMIPRWGTVNGGTELTQYAGTISGSPGSYRITWSGDWAPGEYVQQS